MSYRKEKTPILEPGPKTKCWGQAPKPGPETTAPEKMNKPLLVLFQKNNHQRSTYACKCLPCQRVPLFELWLKREYGII